MNKPNPLTTIGTLLVPMLCLMLTACSALGKRDDGSLAYQTAKKLPPLQLPAEQATADFIPIYPTPNLGANTLSLTNEAGTQYRLPPPPKTVR